LYRKGGLGGTATTPVKLLLVSVAEEVEVPAETEEQAAPAVAGTIRIKLAGHASIFNLADALQSGDLYVVDAEDFADYRDQLLPWQDCQPRLADYCAALGIAENGVDFAAALKQELTSLAEQVDAGYPANSELSIDRDGTPHLKQLSTSVPPKGLAEFAQGCRNDIFWMFSSALSTGPVIRAISARLPVPTPNSRTPHNGICSPSLAAAAILAPTRRPRHGPEIATAQVLRRINAQHVSSDKLEAAMVDVIDQYARFSLPRHWGSEKTAIADGTHVKLRENNLMGSTHIRYGGIAYHHIAGTYIALFTSFISCGVWEGVHILDAFARNKSSVQPDTLQCRYPGTKRTHLRPLPGTWRQADAANARFERRRLLSSR